MSLIDADALEPNAGLDDGEFWAYSIEQLDSAPTIEPEQRWIPVEEKLPEDTETVLITHRGGTSFGWYNGRYWERGAGQHHRALKTVTAWMPLPEPYTERREG